MCNPIELIDKSYFVVIWVSISMIFFWTYLFFTNNQEKNNLVNGAGYIFSSVSILGGIRILSNHFINDYSSNTIFTLDSFYHYYGGVMVIWVSFIGVKSKLSKNN